MKASVFIATSLDGFIARRDGGIDWLPQAPEEHGYDEFMASVDALVIGRGTYDTVLGFGGWAYGKKPVFVLTSNPSAIKPPKEAVCEAMSGSPQEVVDRLTQAWRPAHLRRRRRHDSALPRVRADPAHDHHPHPRAARQRNPSLRATVARPLVQTCHNAVLCERHGSKRICDRRHVIRPRMTC